MNDNEIFMAQALWGTVHSFTKIRNYLLKTTKNEKEYFEYTTVCSQLIKIIDKLEGLDNGK